MKIKYNVQICVEDYKETEYDEVMALAKELKKKGVPVECAVSNNTIKLSAVDTLGALKVTLLRKLALKKLAA